MQLDLSWERAYHWGVKGGMSVLDQGLYSGANLVFSVLLARWLTRAEYGAYALAFAVLLIFYQFYQSLITDPMGVLGPAHYPAALREYLFQQFRMHFAVTIPFGLLVGGILFLVGSRLAGDPLRVVYDLAVMCVTLPLTLLPWFLRRAFYVIHQPEISAAGSLCYAVGLMGALGILRAVGALNSYTAILSMAGAGLISGLFLFWCFNRLAKSPSATEFRFIFRQNWNYARWLVAASLFMVAAGQMQILMAGNILGVASAGIVDVVQTFSQPMILTIGAISAIALPVMSRDFAQENLSALRGRVTVVTSVLLGLAAAFEVLLIAFRQALEAILYAGKFAAYADLIPVFGIVPILLAMYWGPATGLQAAHRPQAVLVVSVVWLPLSLLLQYVLAEAYGLYGLAMATILGYVSIAVVCWVLYRRWVLRGASAL